MSSWDCQLNTDHKQTPKQVGLDHLLSFNQSIDALILSSNLSFLLCGFVQNILDIFQLRNLRLRSRNIVIKPYAKIHYTDILYRYSYLIMISDNDI